MPKFGKPRIGLLGLMTGGYEDVFPGIVSRQNRYAEEIVRTLSPAADVYFSGAALDRASIGRTVREYNDRDLDGILIVLLAYSQGAWLLRALQENRLPIALAAVQPDQAVLDDWVELDLTVNQGIHGAQDNANMIARLGVPCQYFAGNRKEPGFVEFVRDFSKAAQTARFLKRMRTAVIGRMPGMGDILTDDMAFFREIGPEFRHDTIGSVYARMCDIQKDQIDAEIAADKRSFEIDPKLTYESHAEAVRMYLGFKNYMEEKGFDAVTAHFDVFGDDGRFRQLPLYAASRLLADGYGYAAEGDCVCASFVAAAHCLGTEDGNFTEMYTMDFEKKAILFCHAGESNCAVHREGVRPRLIDRYLGEGGLENPPTILPAARPGRATLVSPASVGGGKFRLLVARGEILDKTDLTGCEMPYMFWRPDSGVEPCVEGWLKNGGTHHEVINTGDVSRRWKMLCGITGMEYAEV